MLVRIDVRKAQLGISRRTCGEECESQLDARQYRRLVVPVMMAVSIKILNQFAWLAMYAEDEGVSLGPRQFYVEVGKMVIPVNTNGVEVTNSLDGYKGVRERARDITRTPHLHGELDVDCPKEAIDLTLKN